MHRLSMVQALGIWSDLEAAYYGKNSFGGDTAEIYMYRLMSSNPRAEAARQQKNPTGIVLEGLQEQIQDANKALHSILKHFAKERNVGIMVNGKELGEWLRKADFDHRVHVKVTH